MDFIKKWDVNPDEIINFIDNNLNSGTIICLNGDLASGKTTFVRKYLEHRNFKNWEGSPTFPIINTYDNGINKIYHIDAYRTNSDDIDVEEALNDESATIFLEWPTMVTEILKYIKEDKIINIYFE